VTYDEFVEFIPLTAKYDTLQLVTAEVDRLYKDRVEVGLEATTSINNEDYSIIVTRVDSTVRNGQFMIEGKITEPIKSARGRTMRIRLRMNEPHMAVLLPVGGFYRDTQGKWVLVMQDDGHVVKRSIKLGKKNTEHFEVIEGLKVGERVITSPYEIFVEDGDLDLEAVVDFGREI
jgi:HlyD family secretion protein